LISLRCTHPAFIVRHSRLEKMFIGKM